MGKTQSKQFPLKSHILSPAIILFLFQDFVELTEEDLTKSKQFLKHEGKNHEHHIYYEGNFQAISDTVTEGLSPRFGVNELKDPVPKNLKIFLQKFKEINAKTIHKIKRNLNKKDSIVCHVIADWFNRGWEFSDVSVQILYKNSTPDSSVKEVDIDDTIDLMNKDSYINWHFDEPNSLLHMAITIAGHRILHIKEGSRSLSYSLIPGDVYISSPATFIHGVEYSDKDWDNRVIAIQCRFFLMIDDWIMIKELIQEKGSKKVLYDFFRETINIEDFVMPTILDLTT